MMPWSTASFAPKVLTALLLLLPVRPATAIEARDLVGWWIAIDRLFPGASETQGIVPMEELLIVGSDGRVENRFMMFSGPDADLCHGKKVHCSDAPISARARIAVDGDQLTFAESVKSDNLIDDRPEVDLVLRLLTVTSTRSWTLSREVDGRLLVLRPNLSNASRLIANIPTRVLAKIDPGRLRRLRALPRAAASFSSFSYGRHWRCFLANATADDPAFASLRDRPRTVPSFLDDAAKAASYFMALSEAAGAWVQGEQTVTGLRNPADVSVERFLLEHFPDIRAPSTAAERARSSKRNRDLTLRLRGETVGTGFPPLTDRELAALARASGDDPEAKRLFCRD